MATTTLPPDAPSWAEQAALRVGQILLGLAALIAARHRRLPSTAMATRLNSFVNRTRQRLLVLLAAFARGRLPRHHAPRPGRARRAEPRRLRLPRAHGWLIRALPNEAIAYAGQLDAILAEPGMADLLARVPTAARILAPLRRLLTVPEPPPPRPTRPTATPPAPAPAPSPAPRPAISRAARRALAFHPL